MRDRLVAAAVLALAATTALATPPLQKKAADLGFPAKGCAYCHSFDTDHMQERARKMGINPGNCHACHAAKLPKTGDALFNERGKWLRAEKAKRKAEAVDPAWLKSYPEPAEKKK